MEKTEADSEVISILLSQDNEAVRSALIQEIRIKFKKIARYKGVDINDIDDVVNSGLEKLVTKLPNYSGRGPLNNWATVLFGNHCTDYFRRIAINKKVFSHNTSNTHLVDNDAVDFETFPGNSPDPQNFAIDQERLNIVVEAIDKIISE